MHLGHHVGALGPRGSSLIIGAIVALGVLVLRNSRPRRLRIDRLWIRPVIFLALMAATLAAAPPPVTAISVTALCIALVVGCALGWQRGRFMRIEFDPSTRGLTSRASPLGMVFILALLVGRMGLRGLLPRGGAVAGLPALTIADALILLAVGMMVAQGVEMWLRARRLLAVAQGANTDHSPSSAPIIR